jgi:hypothetical protein
MEPRNSSEGGTHLRQSVGFLCLRSYGATDLVLCVGRASNTTPFGKMRRPALCGFWRPDFLSLSVRVDGVRLSPPLLLGETRSPNNGSKSLIIRSISTKAIAVFGEFADTPDTRAFRRRKRQ